MKSENAKLLLGLGLGALVGVAVGCYMTAERRKKLEEELNEVGHGIKDGVKSVFAKAKATAEHTGAKMAGKAGEWAEKAGDKAEEWAGKAGAKAEEWADEAGAKSSGVADDISQKANDMRQRMDNKAEMAEQEHARHAGNYQKDVNEMKNRMKGGKDDAGNAGVAAD